LDIIEYRLICSSPDALTKQWLEGIREALDKISSPHGHLIDKVLAEGYIQPPDDYKWHGDYRIILPDQEKRLVLGEINRAISVSLGDNEDVLYLQKSYTRWKASIEEKPISYEEAIKNVTCYNLTNATLEYFQEFVFDHVPNHSLRGDKWFHSSDVFIDYAAKKNAVLFAELFGHSTELLDRYSREQLERGIWAMMSSGFEGNVDDLIWGKNFWRKEEGLDVAEKERLIRSMYDLYAGLFSVDPLEGSSDMWWDRIAHYYPGIHSREDGETAPRILDAMFGTLVRILELKSEPCQLAALHGLGHLQHPDTERAITKHIRAHPELSDHHKDYAVLCINDEML
jgi:hypothetical protein